MCATPARDARAQVAGVCCVVRCSLSQRCRRPAPKSKRDSNSSPGPTASGDGERCLVLPDELAGELAGGKADQTQHALAHIRATRTLRVVHETAHMATKG